MPLRSLTPSRERPAASLGLTNKCTPTVNDLLPKAILFDLDDTVLAFEAVADIVWREISATFAPRLRGVEPDALLSALRQGRKWFWSDPDRHRRGRLDLELARQEVVLAAFDHLGLAAPSLAREIAEAYAVQQYDAVYVFDGALDTLRRLKDHGVRLALVTNGNGEHQRRKIDRFGLASFFDHILIEGEVGLGKPDERVYVCALDRLDSRPSEAWMVGDNLEWEVAAPQRLGITGIWVDSARKGLPASSPIRPDRIIGALPELLCDPSRGSPLRRG